MNRLGKMRSMVPRPAWLAGAIFEKELRVASRRRRSYTLRLAYVLVLTAYIAMVWVPVVQFQGSSAMSRAQMEMAAKMITRGIVWFQFFGAQLAAIVVMSTAISEEVYSRTLGVLMMTPLSGAQVVMSKLSSRLLQILLLVATSLPLLAIVRVLGGIAWDRLVVALCVTATTVVFVSSVTLFFSTLCRRAYVVVIVSALVVLFIFFFLPFLVYPLLSDEPFVVRLFSIGALYVNPYAFLDSCMDDMISRRGPMLRLLPWFASCCTLLLLGSLLILAGSVRLVRCVALRRAMGEPALLDGFRFGHRQESRTDRTPRTQTRDLRRVVGPPMIWKELTCTLSRQHRLATAIIVGVEVLLILIVYSFGTILRVVPYEAAHMLYVWALLGLGTFFTITASATVISMERESRTWPLLLVTPLTDGDILIGKLVGVLRRCGPIWLSLFAYIVAFAWANCFHPLAIAHVTAIILSVLLFLSATGFYFGSRLRRTSEAVTANLVLAGTLWCALPVVGAAVGYGMKVPRWNVGESMAFTCVPFGQALAMVTTTLDGYQGPIRWFGHSLDAAGAAVLMFCSMGGYVLVSFMFVWRAARAFRRCIF